MIATVGRIVLYRTSGGEDYAALVIATENPRTYKPLEEGHVHLRLFEPPWGFQDIQDPTGGTPQAPPSGPIPAHTWRWPERVG